MNVRIQSLVLTMDYISCTKLSTEDPYCGLMSHKFASWLLITIASHHTTSILKFEKLPSSKTLVPTYKIRLYVVRKPRTTI